MQANSIDLRFNKIALSKDLGPSHQEFSPALKSAISASSTVASPLISPRKFVSPDTDTEEDDNCLFFQEMGYCPKGEHCDLEHPRSRVMGKRSFVLENYPEMLLRVPGRRTGSFIC